MEELNLTLSNIRLSDPWEEEVTRRYPNSPPKPERYTWEEWGTFLSLPWKIPLLDEGYPIMDLTLQYHTFYDVIRYLRHEFPEPDVVITLVDDKFRPVISFDSINLNWNGLPYRSISSGILIWNNLSLSMITQENLLSYLGFH